MSEEKKDCPLGGVTGSGGGGGKGGTPTVGFEQRNTLRSKAVINVVDLLCEGPIVGLAYGNIPGVVDNSATPDNTAIYAQIADKQAQIEILQNTPSISPLDRQKELQIQDLQNEILGWQARIVLSPTASSIYFNDTPLRNAAGGANFYGVTFDQRKGYPGQDYLTGFSSVETPHQVGLEIKATTGPKTRQVIDPDVNAIRVVLATEALTYLDTKTGELSGSRVNYTIVVTSIATGESNVLTDTMDGKTVAPYQRAYRMGVVGPAPWSVSVTRHTPDSLNVNLKNNLFWVSYDEIIDGKFQYPDSAIVGLSIDSQNFGSSVPSRSYLVDGLIIKVPLLTTVNGQPFWNGAFTTAWSDNPAWVLMDVITNPRYGLGVPLASVDIGGFFTVAQYCDQLVPSGFGYNEKRYTFNGVISASEDVYNVLQAIAATFRGMIYWSSGSITVRADMPAEPIKLVTPANVIDGVFNYSSTALKTRHSMAQVTWNDPKDYYKPAVEVVENLVALQDLGFNPLNISLIGCTSRGQAHRHGKWILDSEHNQTETINYRAAYDHADLQPGDIISVADPYYAGVRMGGRIKNRTNINNGRVDITLDAPVTLQTGQTYELAWHLNGGGLRSGKVLDGVGTHTVLHTDYVGEVPDEGNVWILVSTNLKPRHFRVLAVQEAENGEYDIVALFHDPTKYARVEQGINLKPIPYVLIPDAAPVTGVTFRQESQVVRGSVIRKLTLFWNVPVSDNTLNITTNYLIMWRKDLGTWSISENITQNTYTLSGIVPGYYEFVITAVNSFGRRSSPFLAVYNSALGGASSLGPVTNIVTIDGGTTFFTPDLQIHWTPPENTTAVETAIAEYEVSIIDVITLQVLFVDKVVEPRYTYGFGSNLRDGGPRRDIKVSIVVIDAWGAKTQPGTEIFHNFPPALPTGTSFAGYFVTLLLTYAAPTEPDFKGALVYMSTATGFIPSASTLVYDGPDTTISIAGVAGTTYYLRFALYDSFGKIGLNMSGELQASTVLISHAQLQQKIIDDSNLLPALGSRISLIDADASTFGSVNARILVETNNRVTETSAMQSQIQTLTSSVNNSSASVQTMQQTVDGMETQWYVKSDINGYMSGFGFASSTRDSEPVSDFVINADRFAIGKTTTAIFLVANGAVRSDGVVTLTAVSAHGLFVGGKVLVGGVNDETFNGVFTITSIPSTTKLTYEQAGANTTSSGGSLSAGPILPFIIDTSGPTAVLSFIGNMSVSNLLSGTITTTRMNIGGNNLFLDGPSASIRVNDGTRDRVRLGRLSNGAYGIDIVDTSGNTILSTDGKLGAGVTIGSSGTTLQGLNRNASAIPLNFVGFFATAPSAASYPINSIYRNTASNTTWVQVGGAWSLNIEPGTIGTRGARTFNMSHGLTIWDNNQANQCTFLQGGPVIGDIVIQTNAQANFAQTRTYDGTTYIPFAMVMDGNLLALGTITGNKVAANTITANNIDSRGLTIKDDNGNIIFGAGVTLDYQTALSNKPGSISRNLLRNSSFERDLYGWATGGEASGGSVGVSISTSFASQGTKSLLLNLAGATTGGSVYAWQTCNAAKGNNLYPNTNYLLSFTSLDSLNGGTATYAVIVRCWNSAHTGSTDRVLTINGGSGYIYSGAAHRQKIAFFTPPDLGDTDVFIRINSLQVGMANAASYFDSVMLEEIGAGNGLVTAAPSFWSDYLEYGATFGGNIFGKITAVNISTYIEAAAIQTAYIANLAVTNAQIMNLTVGTGKIADSAITNRYVAATSAVSNGASLFLSNVYTGASLVFNGYVSGTPSGIVQIDIFKSGVLKHRWVDSAATVGVAMRAITFTDTPTAGSWSYELKIVGGFGNGSIEMLFTTTEYKK